MTGYNLKLDSGNIKLYTPFVEIMSFALVILSRNEILTSIKGHYSDANLRTKM